VTDPSRQDVQRRLELVAEFLIRAHDHVPAAWEQLNASTSTLAAANPAGGSRASTSDSPVERHAFRTDPAARDLARLTEAASWLVTLDGYFAAALVSRPHTKKTPTPVTTPLMIRAVMRTVTKHTSGVALTLAATWPAAHRELASRFVDQLLAASTVIRDIVLEWSGECPDPRPAPEPVETNDWCTNHAQRGRGAEPARTDSLCEFCHSVKLNERYLPDSDLLEVRDRRGSNVVPVREITAFLDRERARRRKSKTKRGRGRR
jgi:hypothetical protein